MYDSFDSCPILRLFWDLWSIKRFKAIFMIEKTYSTKANLFYLAREWVFTNPFDPYKTMNGSIVENNKLPSKPLSKIVVSHSKTTNKFITYPLYFSLKTYLKQTYDTITKNKELICEKKRESIKLGTWCLLNRETKRWNKKEEKKICNQEKKRKKKIKEKNKHQMKGDWIKKKLG